MQNVRCQAPYVLAVASIVTDDQALGADSAAPTGRRKI